MEPPGSNISSFRFSDTYVTTQKSKDNTISKNVVRIISRTEQSSVHGIIALALQFDKDSSIKLPNGMKVTHEKDSPIQITLEGYQEIQSTASSALSVKVKKVVSSK